jgi:hypothetical protein
VCPEWTHANVKRFVFLVLVCLGLVMPWNRAPAQATPEAAASVSPRPSPTSVPVTTPIPLADVFTQADAVEASLQEIQPKSEAVAASTVRRDLPALTRGISAQLAETTQLVKPGVARNLARSRDPLGEFERAT